MAPRDMKRRPQPDKDAFTRFAESIFRINGLLIEAGEGIAGPVGQSSARWQVLGGIGYGPKTVSRLAREIGHARQSVQRLADVLAGEGLLAFLADPADRRSQLMELTPDGMKALKAIYRRQLAWSGRVVGKLPDAQLAAIAAALEEIGDLIAEDTASNPPAGDRTGGGNRARKG